MGEEMRSLEIGMMKNPTFKAATEYKKQECKQRSDTRES